MKNLFPLTLVLDEGWIRVGGGIFELQAGGPAALAATLISNRCWREAASLSPSSLPPPLSAAAYLPPHSQPPRVAYYIRPESEDGKFGKIRKFLPFNFSCFYLDHKSALLCKSSFIWNTFFCFLILSLVLINYVRKLDKSGKKQHGNQSGVCVSFSSKVASILQSKYSALTRLHFCVTLQPTLWRRSQIFRGDTLPLNIHSWIVN